MSAGILGYNPDKKYRLVYDGVGKTYHIQKRRLLFVYKFLPTKFLEHEYYGAKHRLDWLRREHRKTRIKKKYVVLED